MGGAYQWPRLNEVMEYRKTVRQLVCDLISSSSLSLPVSMDNPWVSSQDLVPCDSPVHAVFLTKNKCSMHHGLVVCLFIVQCIMISVFPHFQWSLFMGIDHDR